MARPCRAAEARSRQAVLAVGRKAAVPRAVSIRAASASNRPGALGKPDRVSGPDPGKGQQGQVQACAGGTAAHQTTHGRLHHHQQHQLYSHHQPAHHRLQGRQTRHLGQAPVAFLTPLWICLTTGDRPTANDGEAQQGRHRQNEQQAIGNTFLQPGEMNLNRPRLHRSAAPLAQRLTQGGVAATGGSRWTGGISLVAISSGLPSATAWGSAGVGRTL